MHLHHLGRGRLVSWCSLVGFFCSSFSFSFLLSSLFLFFRSFTLVPLSSCFISTSLSFHHSFVFAPHNRGTAVLLASIYDISLACGVFVELVLPFLLSIFSVLSFLVWFLCLLFSFSSALVFCCRLRVSFFSFFYGYMYHSVLWFALGGSCLVSAPFLTFPPSLRYHALPRMLCRGLIMFSDCVSYALLLASLKDVGLPIAQIYHFSAFHFSSGITRCIHFLVIFLISRVHLRSNEYLVFDIVFAS
ncbi:hypothetical protein CPC08DRAFT_264959 [Agrocybe pediades]|nr:hypothetical protein CPC08DRAFT_264959 [Agrocybe pediades]